jgi:glycerophosphoryl diester phosphodiesterase
MKRRYRILTVAGLAVLGLYAVNNSWSARPAGTLEVMAHRGVHHTYHREGLTRDGCTATRIYPPTHAFIENTLTSTAEAFRLGADVVELDIHPTTDGEFAVFHDWTLDCRTEGVGVTREQSMAYLKTLDIGHGYTADGGATFPLRGTGVGAMPTLNEMLDAFPGRRFMVNIKSNDATEADRLHAYLLARTGSDADRLTVYGGQRPIERLRTLRPQTRTLHKQNMIECLGRYVLVGWIGHIPRACRNTILFVPQGWASALWGWPNRFLVRMQAADTEVWIGGRPDFNTSSMTALDDLHTLSRIPRDWRGGVDTDRIEIIGPAITERR